MNPQILALCNALRIPESSYTSGSRIVYRWRRCSDSVMKVMQAVSDAVPRVVSGGISNYEDRVSFQFIGRTCILTFPPCLTESIPVTWGGAA